MYGHVTDGVVDAVGDPPDTVFFDGRWYDLRTEDPATLAIAGWFPLVETPRPADTATTTHDAEYVFSDDVVTQTWTARPKTEEELARDEAQTNKSAIETNLEEDLAAMQAILDQSNADLRDDPSQEIKDIAQAVRRLTKMALNDFSEPE